MENIIVYHNAALWLKTVASLTQIGNIMGSINFTCIVSGFPLSSVQIDWIWTAPTHNDRIDIINITDDSRIVSMLTIQSLQFSDIGQYKCVASLEGLTGIISYNLTFGM